MVIDDEDSLEKELIRIDDEIHQERGYFKDKLTEDKKKRP